MNGCRHRSGTRPISIEAAKSTKQPSPIHPERGHPLDLRPPRLLSPPASRPGGRCRGTGLCGPIPVEESPGSRDQRWRLTAAGGDPRESATESRPPAGQPVQARVKRCGKSAPRVRQRKRHGKPHREQNRIGAARMVGATCPSSAILAAARVGCSRHGSDPCPRGMAVAEATPDRTRLTGRLAISWPTPRSVLGMVRPRVTPGTHLCAPQLCMGRHRA